MKATELIFDYLDARSPRQFTVAHIAKQTGLPRSSVQKALTSLRNAKKVERNLGDGNGYLWYA